MSSLIVFPNSPLLDKKGYLALEWRLWFQNPNLITANINNIATGTVFGLPNGGTGLTSTPTNGQVLIGNGTGYTLATLTPGTAINITNSAGAITVTNTGVTSLTGTANQVNVSASSGSVTLSTPQNIDTGATPTFSIITTSTAATFHKTSIDLTNGSGASTGTITNAPAAGNPTKWVGINDNGTIRYIPAW